MARKTILQLFSDLDGSEADETVAFSLDGKGMEIDLSESQAGALREALASYIAAGRRNRPAFRHAAISSSEDDPADIRSWAKENGIEVSDRGRVSADVRQAYRNR